MLPTDEPATGADMEWNFVNIDDGSFFRLLIQAKQAYGNGDIWSRHSYQELTRKAPGGLKPQCEVLCESVRTQAATYPLYAFYNPGRTCDLARSDGRPEVAGVVLADGHQVKQLARDRKRSLRSITPYVFGLDELFCSPTKGICSDGPASSTPPTPQELRQRLLALHLKEGGVIPIPDALEVPHVADNIPDEVRDLLSGRKLSRPKPRSIWRATFLSGSLF